VLTKKRQNGIIIKLLVTNGQQNLEKQQQERFKGFKVFKHFEKWTLKSKQ
jgi:hypothetical protein